MLHWAPGHCALGTFLLRRIVTRRKWQLGNAADCFRCGVTMVPDYGGDRVSCFGECGVTNMCFRCWGAATSPWMAVPPCVVCGAYLERRSATNVGGDLVYLCPDVVVTPGAGAVAVGGAGSSAADGEAVGEAGASGEAGPSGVAGE